MGKTNSKNKVLLILILTVLIGSTIAFFLTREKAIKPISDNSSTALRSKFYSYDVNSEGYIRLIKRADGSYAFIDESNNTLLSIRDEVLGFESINNKDLVYIVKHKSKQRAYHIDLSSSKTTLIAEGYELYVKASNNKFCVLDKQSNIIYYGDKGSFIKIKPSHFVDKIIESKGKFYLISYKTIDSKIISYLDVIEDSGDTQNIYSTEGKITWVNAYYKNPNKIYLTIEEGDSSIYVKSLYVNNLSLISSGEETYSYLNGYIVSLKNNLLLVNLDEKTIYKLNHDMTIDKAIAKTHTNLISNLIQEDRLFEKLYFINNLDELTYIGGL